MSRTRPAFPGEPLDHLWKLLADPTRRRILDLLREAPRTTGALADEFPLSRYGVMKHLQILADGGLVTIRRQGRERWNHVNPLPLQRLFQRWVTPWEAAWNEGLENLRTEVLKGVNDAMSENNVGTVTVAIDLDIEAPAARVWEALIREVRLWWPRDFHIGGESSRMTLEPFAGGRLFEEWGDGAGLLWAQVIAIDPSRSIQLAGHLSPEYGGPATSIWKIALHETDAGTRLELTDSLFGRVDGKLHGSLESGWRTIFEGLKSHLETAQVCS
jgi:DNA-binding transcriptional ArsR family regulator/uncharacterized protein YndB with AHSA1/START domain